MGKTLVIGLGISGQAASALLISKGGEVVAVDRNRELLASPPIEQLREKGLVAVHESSIIDLDSFSLVVVSPGVPPTDRLYRLASEKKLEIIGEVELSLREIRQPCVGITGTNGKTTVTLLVEHILKLSGKKARALGNVGLPLASYFIQPDPEEILVIELSSYQLETLQAPVFDVGVILNITPDHLDRYPSMEEYAAAKWRLKNCMKPGSPFYVHPKIIQEFGKSAEIYTTFLDNLLSPDYRKRGVHECENALAAWCICREFQVSKEEFIKGLETFIKPAHRIELVKMVKGVYYYDDSKGTNIDAVIQAVGAMSGPVLLIAGGVDKGASYALWKKPFAQKVKKIFVIGKAAEKICCELQEAFPVEKIETLEKAVERAAFESQKGDCVLLSPGCSSYDMFRDYAHRGEEFKKCVNFLEEKNK